MIRWLCLSKWIFSIPGTLGQLWLGWLSYARYSHQHPLILWSFCPTQPSGHPMFLLCPQHSLLLPNPSDLFYNWNHVSLTASTTCPTLISNIKGSQVTLPVERIAMWVPFCQDRSNHSFRAKVSLRGKMRTIRSSLQNALTPSGTWYLNFDLAQVRPELLFDIIYGSSVICDIWISSFHLIPLKTALNFSILVSQKTNHLPSFKSKLFFLPVFQKNAYETFSYGPFNWFPELLGFTCCSWI